jgi:hypothetical protein
VQGGVPGGIEESEAAGRARDLRRGGAAATGYHSVRARVRPTRGGAADNQEAADPVRTGLENPPVTVAARSPP